MVIRTTYRGVCFKCGATTNIMKRHKVCTECHDAKKCLTCKVKRDTAAAKAGNNPRRPLSEGRYYNRAKYVGGDKKGIKRLSL